jgi:hypothetical protein
VEEDDKVEGVEAEVDGEPEIEDLSSDDDEWGLTPKS